MPEPNSLVVAVGDVSGKAMPAALLMTSLQARVRVLAELPEDPGTMLTRLNRHTAANCPSNRFVTFVFAVVDSQSGQIEYANAGHNPPLLVKVSGEVEALTGGGLIMGLFPTAQYESYAAQLQAGDSLVVFSDGVTEATDATGAEYGDDRLASVLVASRTMPAKGMVDALKDDLAAFIGSAPAADDTTVVVVRKV